MHHHHHYNDLQAETKRKTDHQFTHTLVARSELVALTPEEIERLDEIRSEWAVNWDNLTSLEQLSYMSAQLKKALAHSIY